MVLPMTSVTQHPMELAGLDRWNSDSCSIARTLALLSSRSAFLVLREASYGTTRFDDFAARANISEPVAAKRLAELTDAGLLEREPYKEPGQRTRNRYVLTEKGRDLLPALIALMQWGDRWLADGSGPIELTHRDCGEKVRAELRCAAGHEVGRGDLAAELRGNRK